MDVDLIRKALTDAYDLIRQEQESVCVEWLTEEYEIVLDGLRRALIEVESGN